MAAPQGVLLCASAKSCPGTFSRSDVFIREASRAVSVCELRLRFFERGVERRRSSTRQEK